MWESQLGAFVPISGNWRHSMYSINQEEELLLQSTALPALGLKEEARTY